MQRLDSANARSQLYAISIGVERLMMTWGGPEIRFAGYEIAEGGGAIVRFRMLDDDGGEIGVYLVDIEHADDERVGAAIAEGHRRMSAITRAWSEALSIGASEFDRR